VPAAPSTPLERDVDALYALHRLGGVALTPDGARVAWVESFDVPGTASTTSIVRAVDRTAASVSPRTLTAGAGAHREHDVAWSPDGKSLAFVSDARQGGGGAGKVQLYLAAFDAPEAPARALTQLTGALSSPRFSPDGKRVAVLYTDSAELVGPVEAVTPMVGEVEAHASVQRIALVDVASAQVKMLSRPDLYVHEIAWSPDGTRLAAVAGAAPGDNHWYDSKLVTVDATSGQDAVVHAPALQIAEPRWSPDGKSIAFIGGLMSDEGSTGGDVFVVPSDGSAPPRNLTPGLRASARTLVWPKADRIVFGAVVDGGSALDALDPGAPVRAPASPQVLWSGPEESLDSVAFGASGEVTAVARESFTKAAEVWAGETGAWKQITHVNDAHAASAPGTAVATSVHWKSDGQLVQGWLLAPGGADPTRRAPLAPMVVQVHGGPAAAAMPQQGVPQLLASRGYYVLMPNPRGSFGQGEAFAAGNVKDLGHGDMRDIMAGVDEVLRTAPVDPARLMLTGWSYGGYMTMWMVTQTARFRAAVAGAGIADWRSYWGQNAIAEWMLPYFGATVYDDPKAYARSSPIEFIKQVRTPTLVMVGERDGECPAPQSQQFWRALQAQGVETRLVVYAGEGHALRKPENRRDRIVRVLDWFDKHS
jgi:dipeptidyl aminopeptidase/acylaminoacyl peptidase